MGSVLLFCYALFVGVFVCGLGWFGKSHFVVGEFVVMCHTWLLLSRFCGLLLLLWLLLFVL